MKIEDLDGHGQHEYPTRAELFSDAAAIEYGLREADRDERPIDDATVRRIAMSLHTGQFSHFYVLGSSGAIQRFGIRTEFMTGLRDTPPEDEETLGWFGALYTYVLNHEDRGPQPGWSELTRDDMPVVAWLESGDAI